MGDPNALRDVEDGASLEELKKLVEYHLERVAPVLDFEVRPKARIANQPLMLLCPGTNIVCESVSFRVPKRGGGSCFSAPLVKTGTSFRTAYSPKYRIAGNVISSSGLVFIDIGAKRYHFAVYLNRSNLVETKSI